MHRYSLVVIALLCCIFLSGCEKQQSAINVIYFAGLPEGQIIKENLETFTKETGIKVNFLEIPYDAVRTKEITSVKQGQGAYDVMYVDDIWLYEYAKQRIVIDLDSLIRRDSKEVNFDDFIEKVRVAEAELDGKTWLIPQRADAQCLFYRKDLFEDEQNKRAFEEKYGYALKPPDTWLEFKDVAEFFTRDTDGDGKIDQYGTILTLKRPHFAFEFFAMRYWAFSDQQFIDENQNPLFDSPEGIEALQFLCSLRDYAPPGVSNWQHDEAISAFGSGMAAMCPQWFAFHAVLANPKSSKIADKLGVTLVPGMMHDGSLVRAPSIGGGSFGIPVDSKQKGKAWEFIKYMTSTEFMRQAALQGAIVTRRSAYENPELIKERPAFALHLQSLDISWFRPRLERFAEFQEIVGLAVSRAFVGEMTPEQALEIASKDTKKILK